MKDATSSLRRLHFYNEENVGVYDTMWLENFCQHVSQSILLPLLFSISKAPCDIAGLSMLAAEETDAALCISQ